MIAQESERTPDPQRSKGILRLSYNARANTIAPREIKGRRRLSRRLGTIYYDALECGPLLRFGRGQERRHTGCAKPALPNLLATHFHFHLPSRLHFERRSRYDAGFFSHGS